MLGYFNVCFIDLWVVFDYIFCLLLYKIFCFCIGVNKLIDIFEKNYENMMGYIFGIKKIDVFDIKVGVC